MVREFFSCNGTQRVISLIKAGNHIGTVIMAEIHGRYENYEGGSHLVVAYQQLGDAPDEVI